MHIHLMYNVHYTLYIIQCIEQNVVVYNVHSTQWCEHSIFSLYTVQCIVYNIHCTVYTVQCTVYTLQCTVYIVHCILYTMRTFMYIMHSNQYIYSVHILPIDTEYYLISIFFNFISIHAMGCSTQMSTQQLCMNSNQNIV